MRFLLLLVLVVTIGCGSDDADQPSTTTTGSDSQQQPNDDSAKEKTAPSDSALSDEQATTKPGAYETYDAATSTFHGTVMEGLPTGASGTWTVQFVDQNKTIYTGSFREDDKVQSTRIDTLERVKAADQKP